MGLVETVPTYAGDAFCQKLVAKFSDFLKNIFARAIKEFSQCKRLCGWEDITATKHFTFNFQEDGVLEKWIS